MTFKQIIRGVGRTGEKYLARTRQEYFQVLGSGSGAGAITASTVLLKFLILWLKLPLLLEALLFGLNYASSFLLMQSLGFRLATKQPSLLAVTLVRRRRTNPKRSLRAQLLAITRSQFAATLGNFGLVIVCMVAFHLGYTAWKGAPFISNETALHSIGSLDPFRVSTLAYAALTGGLLWCASLVSGWAAHAARKIRLASSLGRTPSLRERLLRPVLKHAAGLGFNVSLAFLLCAIPYAGNALHLPIDVRHFTLSSGALALAVCTLGLKGAWLAGLPHALIGILMIGLLNFGVSFVLSLFAALATHELDWRRNLPDLMTALLVLLRTPLVFLLPLSRLPAGAREIINDQEASTRAGPRLHTMP